jgi:DNA-binding GntR family transcriptional regulator
MVNRQTIYPAKLTREIIYKHLKQEITNGSLMPNERIIEAEYAEMFQVSRTPVREALRMLEMDGLVKYIPKKGMIVRGLLSEDEIDEIFAIRKALEVAALDKLIQCITSKEIDYLSKMLLLGEQSLKNNDLKAYANYARLFNNALLEYARMPKLANMIKQMQNNLSIVRQCNVTNKSRQCEVIKEHRKILEAIKDKDIDKLKEATVLHIENSKRTFKSRKV